MKRNKQLGFTLIELLVVVTIMSILTIITVGQFSSAKMKARDAQRKLDMDSMSKALQMYYSDYGVFPVNINGSFTSKDWVGGELKDAANYIYMKVLPKDNTQNDTFPYCYVASADLKKFALFTKIENSEDPDCKGRNFTCNGKAGYCFSAVSPNTTASELDNIVH